VQPLGLSQRQNRILAEAARGQMVVVEDLAEMFGVSPQTVRKDLNHLCARGLLARVHGGATVASSVSNVAYDERRNHSSESKQAIARIAADLVPANSSLILNIGTTTEHVARALYNRTDLVVVTNNINVVNILSGSPRKEIRLAGGVVRQSDGAIVGEATVAFINQFKVDLAIIGASALDEDGAVLDFDDREVAVARAIIENARESILVAHRQKFERTAPVRICDIGRLDYFVTDSEPPEQFVRACMAGGTRILTPERVAAEAHAAGQAS
jgi:DeoR family transcriptional regulator, glycerol-3-phosphate regulon repressor